MFQRVCQLNEFVHTVESLCCLRATLCQQASSMMEAAGLDFSLWSQWALTLWQVYQRCAQRCNSACWHFVTVEWEQGLLLRLCLKNGLQQDGSETKGKRPALHVQCMQLHLFLCQPSCTILYHHSAHRAGYKPTRPPVEPLFENKTVSEGIQKKQHCAALRILPIYHCPLITFSISQWTKYMQTFDSHINRFT